MLLPRSIFIYFINFIYFIYSLLILPKSLPFLLTKVSRTLWLRSSVFRSGNRVPGPRSNLRERPMRDSRQTTQYKTHILPDHNERAVRHYVHPHSARDFLFCQEIEGWEALFHKSAKPCSLIYHLECVVLQIPFAQ